MSWLKRNPVAVNLILSFVAAILASLWTNYFTGSDDRHPMTDRKNLLLLCAVLLLLLQWAYNVKATRVDKRVVNDLLDLGIRFIRSHANRDVRTDDVRGIVHLCQDESPGKGLKRQHCLVPAYWISPVRPRDVGAIPTDDPEYQRWYVNVRAFRDQRFICGEPVLADRPSTPGAYINTPSLFEAKSVVAVPIWSRVGGPDAIIGTMTFDSTHTLAELDWCANGVESRAVRNMLEALADLIGKVLSNDDSNT